MFDASAKAVWVQFLRKRRGFLGIRNLPTVMRRCVVRENEAVLVHSQVYLQACLKNVPSSADVVWLIASVAIPCGYGTARDCAGRR